MLHTYQAKVRIGGGLVSVSVQARSTAEARMILESQHGSGSVTTTPTQR